MRPRNYLLFAAIGFAALATQGRAQSSADIDRDAIAALNKMGNYLRTLKAFQVKADMSSEDVYQDGQKVQYETSVDMLARAPNGLRVDVNGDRQQRLYLYDGKNFTLFGQRTNYYATVPAPPTIRELVERLQDKFDIDVPLVDLFYWGTDLSTVKEIKSAIDVGASEVGGTTCEQYIFRQPGIDWQVWIQQGDFPLPRKLVLTTTDDDAKPQHSSVLTWNLAPSFNDATFTFDPPKDAQKIVFFESK